MRVMGLIGQIGKGEEWGWMGLIGQIEEGEE